MTVVREMPESRYILTPLSVVANVHVYCSVQMGSLTFFHRVDIYTLKMPTQLFFFSAGVHSAFCPVHNFTGSILSYRIHAEVSCG